MENGIKLKRIQAAILTLPDGQTVHVERIGRGRYSTAWKNGTSVYVQTHEKDLGKELLCNISETPHLPLITHLETSGIYNWYKMPLYQKLTAKHKEAWADFRHLQRLQDSAFKEERAVIGYGKESNPANVNSLFLSKVEEDVHLTESGYADAIGALGSWCGSYGGTWLIERLQARNCAVDAHGRLILLDPVFDLAEVRAEQEKRRKRARGY